MSGKTRIVRARMLFGFAPALLVIWCMSVFAADYFRYSFKAPGLVKARASLHGVLEAMPQESVVINPLAEVPTPAWHYEQKASSFSDEVIYRRYLHFPLYTQCKTRVFTFEKGRAVSTIDIDTTF